MSARQFDQDRGQPAASHRDHHRAPEVERGRPILQRPRAPFSGADAREVVARLQRTIGNRAVADLWRHRGTSPSRSNGAGTSGLPKDLLAGAHAISGLSLGDVRVHYRSPEPARLQASAYTQGSDIYVSPGQEQHVAHEAWHIVQQAQGRVAPTMYLADGVPVNDDVGLEHEADVMSHRALRAGHEQALTLDVSSLGGGVGPLLRGANTIQRMLVTGHAQLQRFKSAAYQQAADTNTYQRVVEALTAYSDFVDRSPDSLIDANPGKMFIEHMGYLTGQITKSIAKFVEHKAAKWLDTAWLRDLAQVHIPETMGWATKLSASFAAYKNPKWTYLSAMDDLRTRGLESYFDPASTWGNRPMTLMEKNFILSAHPKDAEIVTNIRERAREMIDRGDEPRAILKYIADEGTKFVKQVVDDSIADTGMTGRPLAVVGTGSFGAGELFPYSDVDVQVLTSSAGPGQASRDEMEWLLHFIRQRVRLATMKEEGGSWMLTKGWDIDQLVAQMYDPVSSAAADKLYKSLAYTTPMSATATGGQLASELQTHYVGTRAADAVSVMDNDLVPRAQRDWRYTDKDADATTIEFKEKFMRLPKVLLNVLALYYDLKSQNSWARVDELAATNKLSPKFAGKFKTYLDIVNRIRLKYQLFYESEGLDTVAQVKGLTPRSPDLYRHGYYVLSSEDKSDLKKAVALQHDLLELIDVLNAKMHPKQ